MKKETTIRIKKLFGIKIWQEETYWTEDEVKEKKEKNKVGF